MLRDEGYEVSYRSTEQDWKRALERPGDLVVAAGGDGTVAKVAISLAHSGTPLTVMPLGTANNIAKTLGIAGDAREFIRTWREAVPRPFSLGLVTSSSETQPFVEGFGGGIFADLIAVGGVVGDALSILGRETDRALHLLRSVAAAARPLPWGGGGGRP